MATLQVEITPFEVPETVTVLIGSEAVEVPLEELDEETLSSLIEEFAAAVTQKAGQVLATSSK